MDAIDSEILKLLRENGRASFASIGARVGLSPHGTADRVRRLQRDGVIRSFTTIVDPGSVGRSLEAFIDVRIAANADPEGFERHVASLPAVRELTFLTGRFDYLVRVACRDADDLDRTVRSIRRDAGAVQTETRIVMRATAYSRDLG
jgi:Lrp/AsnC family transcriptional regulator, leucine-responsive regulatory protein